MPSTESLKNKEATRITLITLVDYGLGVISSLGLLYIFAIMLWPNKIGFWIDRPFFPGIVIILAIAAGFAYFNHRSFSFGIATGPVLYLLLFLYAYLTIK